MKVEISVPDPIFEAAELLAKQRRVPSGQLFAEALHEWHGAAAVTTKLNEVYSHEPSGVETPLAQAQYASVARETW